MKMFLNSKRRHLWPENGVYIVHRVPRIRNLKGTKGMWRGTGSVGLKMSGKTGFYVVNLGEKGKHIFLLSKNF